MPTQGQTGSYTTVLPFQVNDVGQDSLFSITVAEGDDILPAGQTMAKKADGTYTAYDGGTAGVDTAAGFLVNEVDPTNGNELGSLQVMGVVRSAMLAGLDADAMADLANHFIFV